MITAHPSSSASIACYGVKNCYKIVAPISLPAAVNINSRYLCDKDKLGTHGWTLDIYDGNEKKIGTLRCDENGRLSLVRGRGAK